MYEKVYGISNFSQGLFRRFWVAVCDADVKMDFCAFSVPPVFRPIEFMSNGLALSRISRDKMFASEINIIIRPLSVARGRVSTCSEKLLPQPGGK